MRIAVSILVIYLSLCALLYLFQRKLEYLPSGELKKPEAYKLYEFSVEILPSYDGTELALWYKKPKDEQKEILVFFHGNAGNLGDRADKLEMLARYTGYGIAALSYRGYPGSQGKPSEEAFIKDAEWLIKYLETQGYEKENIVLYGESLGTALAIKLAAQFEVKALILEAPFWSALEVAKQSYWYIPLELLMKDKYESFKHIKSIKSPTLFIHGTADNVTPVEHSRRLYLRMHMPLKKKLEVEGAGHIEFDNYFLVKQVTSFIAEQQ